MSDAAPRPERYGTELLHDEPNVRVVGFLLGDGQSVPPHRSDSTVIVQVTEGEGLFRGEDGEARLAVGGAVVYRPGELHSMEPIESPLRFLAIITPRPA
jgi:quercetin dioxygenase-like cupin family protein